MTKTPQIDAIPGMTPLGFSPKPKSWKAEVIADNSGQWVSNALRFATATEAERYVSDLAMRWTAVRQTRVVECDDPVTEVR
jgi:hypothetical protein